MNNVDQNPQEETPKTKIIRGINALCIPGQVYELRCLKAGKYRTISGYFDDLDDMADAALNLSDGRAVPAVYTTLNPVRRDLIGRSHNATKDYAEATTADRDILRLRRLLVDLDAIRPSGISATHEEHSLALRKAEEVRDHLLGLGWPDPVFADSGNGGHLIFGVDLENTMENVKLLEGVLKALDGLFSTDRVKVDTTTFNASRITKLPGTMARKGDHIPDFCPHRRSCILDAPHLLEAVPVTLLRELAGVKSDPRPEKGLFDRRLAEVLGQADPRPEWVDDVPVASGAWTQGRLESWLDRHEIEHREPVVDHDGRLKYVLDRCVFDPSHEGRDAAVFFTPEGENRGLIGYKCFHDSCSGKRWADVRELFDPKHRRRPTDQGDTSWLDDLAAKVKGGDGANAFEIPEITGPGGGRATGVDEDGEASSRALYRGFLESKGIECLDAGSGTGDTHHRYLASCPCCGQAGLFLIHKKTLKREYNCGGRSGVTWGQATSLWAGPRGGRRAFTTEELDEIPMPNWVVRDHILERSVAACYGASNVGKTFYALDLALSVATGSDFLGQFAVMKGSACYVLGEGVGGLRKRVQAWKEKRGMLGKIEGFAAIPYTFDLTGAGEAEVGEILRLSREKLGAVPSLVVLDTVSKHFGPGDENATVDMKAFTDCCGRFTEAGAAVLLVHHTGKDPGRGMRGNYTLVANIDTVIYCEEFGQRRGMDLICQKQKDAGFFAPYRVHNEEVAFGDGVTSLVLDYQDGPLADRPASKNRFERLVDEEEKVLHFSPTGEANARSKASIVEAVQAGIRATGRVEIPGVNKIRQAIDTLVLKGRLIVLGSANSLHNKFYKPESDSSFDVPDVEFFGDDGSSQGVEQAREMEGHLTGISR